MKKYIYFEELDSTSIYAKAMAKEGASEGTVIIADRQLGGYGRMGRSFHSPKGTGLYMSIILRPCLSPEKTLYITTAAAVAVAQVLCEVASAEFGIKWVNDIYLNGKKVCGILTEAGFSNNGRLDYAVLGIGINISLPKEGFPDEIKESATAAFDAPINKETRMKLTDMIVDKFFEYYKKLEDKEYLPYYKAKNITVGKEVTVITSSESYPACVLDIDDEFHLIVKNNKGNIITLSSGEVSIKV